MKKYIFKTCDSLREAIQFIKNELIEIDKKCIENWNWYKENMPETIKNKTMEEENWDDVLYLVYRSDYPINEECWIFQEEYNIECWLKEKWWDMWEYDTNDLNENLVIWEFHRNICKEKHKNLYKKTKPFINGWSRKLRYIEFKNEPVFSVI